MLVVMPRVKPPVDPKELAKDPEKARAFLKDVLKKVDTAIERVIKNKEIEELDEHAAQEPIPGELDVWVIENPTWKTKKPRRFKVEVKDPSDLELVRSKNGCTGSLEGMSKKAQLDDKSINGEVWDLGAAHVIGVKEGLNDPTPSTVSGQAKPTAAKPTPAAPTKQPAVTTPSSPKAPEKPAKKKSDEDELLEGD
jgi:hypothetical protein